VIWWLWVVFGIVLIGVEAATPGTLFFLFFGLSAVVVGALTALGVTPQPWLQWLLFSVLAIAALALLRGPLKGRLNLKGSTRAVDSLVGQVAIALSDIPAEGVGKVELRGTSWNARSANGAALGQGQRTLVEKVDGLTLWVRPE
jgi:inner membrane protein